MNVDNQVLMHLKAGQIAPDEMVKLICDKKPTSFGFAVQDKDGDAPCLTVERMPRTTPGFDDLKRVIVNTKDFPRSFCFQFGITGKDDNVQPFVIADNDGKDFLAIFHEGTLIGDYKADENYTEHYAYIDGVIIPKLVEWCEDFDGDIEKIMKKVKDKRFTEDYLKNISPRGILHIMPYDGDVLWAGANDLGGDYDWGHVTQRLGFGDPKVVKEAPTAASGEKFPEKRKGWWSKAAGEVAPDPAADPAGPAKPDDKPADAGTPVKDGATVPLAAKPPHWCKSNDDVKLFYDIVGGKVHPQWKKRLPITVVDFEAVKIDNLADFKKYALSKKLKTTGGNPKDSTSAGPVPAATAAHDKGVISGTVGDPALPIIPSNKLEQVLDFVSKHLDTSSKEITPPKEIQDMEQALPKFSEAVGLDFMETINWPVNGLVGMARTDIMALVCYAVEWRARYRALASGQPMAGDKTVKETAKAVTTTTTNGTSTKVESVAKEAPPAPKKSSWGRKAA